MCAIFISRIRIQNIKGQSSWENVFDGLNSNKVNLFVAPNGFGKSTLTTAFAAASHGKMRLSSDDYYEGNLANVPKLEITYRDNDGNTHCVSSDNEHGDVSKAFSIYVINSPVSIALCMQKQQGEIWAAMPLNQQSFILRGLKSVKSQISTKFLTDFLK